MILMQRSWLLEGRRRLHRIQRYLALPLLAAALIAPAATIGCSARVRVYDADHRDWHRWNDREDRAYRRYWSERQEEYREFPKLNDREKSDYWNWRHSHPDADRH